MRATLTRCLDYDGPYEELPAWFERHKDELVFDPASGRFAAP